MGRDQVSGGVGVPCQYASPVANVPLKPLISQQKVEFGKKKGKKRSRIGIKSHRWRVIIVFGQATECHLAFVREELHIV